MNLNTEYREGSADRWRAARILACALTFAAAGFGGAACAEPETAEAEAALHLGISYTGDVVGVVSGGARRGADYVDELVVSADIDLDQALGWGGFSVHLDLDAHEGENPSGRAFSALGVDGAEADDDRLRLGQAYVQKIFADGRGSMVLGFYDIGADFYAAPASDLFVGAGSGLAPELAESGPNGPSDYPETALTLRVRYQPGASSYLQVMAANGRAGTFGSAGGASLKFHDGLVLVGEAGLQEEGGAKLGVGLWTFTEKQADLREVTSAGDPVRRTAHGAYVVAQYPILAPADDVRRTTAWLKAGLSDGTTTPWAGSWNVGVTTEHVFAGRPDSILGVAVTQGRFAGRHRANEADVGEVVGRSETIVELTYADRVAAHLIVQPDIQWVHRPSGHADVDDALVVGVRFAVEF